MIKSYAGSNQTFATKIIKNLDKNLSRLKIKNIPNFLLDDFALIKKGFYIKN